MSSTGSKRQSYVRCIMHPCASVRAYQELSSCNINLSRFPSNPPCARQSVSLFLFPFSSGILSIVLELDFILQKLSAAFPRSRSRLTCPRTAFLPPCFPLRPPSPALLSPSLQLSLISSQSKFNPLLGRISLYSIIANCLQYRYLQHAGP